MSSKSRAVLFAESNAMEAELLNWLADFESTFVKIGGGGVTSFNPRWRAVARTHFEEGFMALNKAIAGGGRTKA